MKQTLKQTVHPGKDNKYIDNGSVPLGAPESNDSRPESAKTTIDNTPVISHQRVCCDKEHKSSKP